NIQRSRIGHTRLDASVDFFAIAAPASDRLYTASGESRGERVLTWPETTGFNLGWQATPFQKASFQYQLRFDGYTKDTTTADTFEVPSSTVTQGFGGAWEYRRAGYSLLLNGTWFGRAAWQPWGLPQPGQPAATTTSPAAYEKYQASLSRDFFIGPFQKLHLNGAYFGGQDLDRFSRYQFGLFDDTRIHGVPSSGVRYGELAMARGSYSLNVFEQYRLDLYLARGAATIRATARGIRSRGWAWLSMCGRRGIPFCAPTSARVSCRPGTGRWARPSSRSCCSSRCDDPDAPRGPSRPHVPLDPERQPAVSRQPRLLFAAGRRVPRREGARDGSGRVHRSRFDRRRAGTARRASRSRGRHRRRRRGLVPSAGRQSAGAPRRVRDDRGAAPRPPAAARRRLRRDRAAARGERLFRAESSAAFLSRRGSVRSLPAAAR